MDISENKISIRDLIKNYSNDDEEGVVAFDNNLDVRPKYQREFVYSDDKRDEVIRTVFKKLPLNVMYWVDRGEDVAKKEGLPRYEILDGQQRTVAICEYCAGNFSVDDVYYDNMQDDTTEDFLNYKLFIYICKGTDSEKLDWFKIINIAGEQLTDQEMRNAVYAGSWVSDAKRYFSKTGCAAHSLASDYLSGKSIRQHYLETALKWICDKENISIKKYMAQNQHNPSAQPLWSYFRSVIEWVEAVFPKKRKEMRGLPWGIFYNKHHERNDLDPKILEKRIQELLKDEEVTRKSGLYEYLLTGNDAVLNLRKFNRRDALAAYEKQNHKCNLCGKTFEFEQMQADHIKPWSKGGLTVPENCQMLCKICNIKKSNN